MDDPTVRRSVGLLCLAAVGVVIGEALIHVEGPVGGLGTVLAALSFFTALFAVARIGLHYFRS